MGLYLPPLRIIALHAPRVNSLKHAEEHSLQYEHETATGDTPPSGWAWGEWYITACITSSSSMNLHWLLLLAAEWSQTDSLALWILGWLMTPDKKYWRDERQIDDYSFFGCLLGSPLSFSCGSVIIPVWWCRAFTSKPTGGQNLISFLLTHPVLFLCDVARLHCDKSFPWMKTRINESVSFLSLRVGFMFTLDEIWPVDEGQKEGEEKVWWTVCHMINLHPFQLLFPWSHLGQTWVIAPVVEALLLNLLDLIPLMHI